MIALNEKNVIPFAIAGLIVVASVHLLLRKTISGAATAVNDARIAAGSAIGETVFNWFHPNPTTPDVFVSVTFPDGRVHAISQRDIDANGFFVGTRSVYPWHDGKRYRIGTRDGVRYAVAE